MIYDRGVKILRSYAKKFMGESNKQNAGVAPGAAHCWHHKKKKIFLGLVLVLIVLFVSWIGLVGINLWLTGGFPTSTSDWQAVFLTNNQVYFGHLKAYGPKYATLDTVFYLSVSQTLQPAQKEQTTLAQNPTLNLVKLGGELHGPQDMMFIPVNTIMFWENMKKDSQVAQAINNFQKNLKQ